jgi:hypothetical protein
MVRRSFTVIQEIVYTVIFGNQLNLETSDVSLELMKVLPVNFTTEHMQMLSHLQLMINEVFLAIPKQYEKLITSLSASCATEYNLERTN